MDSVIVECKQARRLADKLLATAVCAHLLVAAENVPGIFLFPAHLDAEHVEGYAVVAGLGDGVTLDPVYGYKLLFLENGDLLDHAARNEQGDCGCAGDCVGECLGESLAHMVRKDDALRSVLDIVDIKTFHAVH